MRGLSPDDEMPLILEAMGILALLTRRRSKDIADERVRFKEFLERVHAGAPGHPQNSAVSTAGMGTSYFPANCFSAN